MIKSLYYLFQNNIPRETRPVDIVRENRIASPTGKNNWKISFTTTDKEFLWASIQNNVNFLVINVVIPLVSVRRQYLTARCKTGGWKRTGSVDFPPTTLETHKTIDKEKASSLPQKVEKKARYDVSFCCFV